ncbi:hypothetical protein ABZT51_41305, partial [Streptomyces sp. NPDC005373]|uniref:hypothetical protein n=1 Tax=Streptomyces sp. NPDC005373 TaxID=3156879 RepID=UPI0033AA3CA4
SPPQRSSCSNSSTTAPSDRSHNAMICYWQRLTEYGQIPASGDTQAIARVLQDHIDDMDA